MGICYNIFKDETTCTEGAIRLVGGADDYEGRIEICHDGVWGTICDDFWSGNDGVVACGQLGLDFVSTTTRASYGEGTGEIWLDNVMCTGSETELLDCTHNGFGVHNCIHREDAGLICGSKLIATSFVHKNVYLHLLQDHLKFVLWVVTMSTKDC